MGSVEVHRESQQWPEIVRALKLVSASFHNALRDVSLIAMLLMCLRECTLVGVWMRECVHLCLVCQTLHVAVRHVALIGFESRIATVPWRVSDTYVVRSCGVWVTCIDMCVVRVCVCVCVCV